MIRRFFGGIILGAETECMRDAGKISFRNENIAFQADTNASLAFWATSKSLKYREDTQFSLLLKYSEIYFSEFAFDILALLKGTYQPHVLSSIYCMDTTPQEIAIALNRVTLIPKLSKDMGRKLRQY